MKPIKFRLNGKDVSTTTHPTMRLLDVLRDQFHHTGVKEGCGEGECGACSVFLDGKIVNSCMVPIANVMNKNVITIEGYRTTKQYKILEDAYSVEGAVQCGFCTPGMIMASEALLRKNPHPNEKEIKDGISGNLCRCTGYSMIVNAIKRASEKGDGLW